MTFADETDRDYLRWHWHWSLWPLVEMLGPGFVWGVGMLALGYPPTWVDMVEETKIVEAACLAKLKEKLEWD